MRARVLGCSLAAFCAFAVAACNGGAPTGTGGVDITQTSTPPATGTPSPSSTTVTSVSPPVTMPEDSVVIEVGDSIQDAIESAPEGATFWLSPGIHRLATAHPKSGQIFLGAPRAILSGAIVLTEFVEMDGRWIHGGIDARGEERGQCAGQSTCRLPEDMFFDGGRLTRVASLGEVDENSWYLDHDTATAYVGRDPSAAEVEVSVLPYAFGGEATDVTIQNLIIEKYASPAQQGAIMSGRGWVIVGNEIRHNHGAGLYPSSNLVVTDNHFHHNGQFAIDGGGNDSIYERNEIAYNNYLGEFSFEWGAGAVKFVHTTNLVLRDNYVHNNHGPGLWIDGYNVNTLFEGNRVVDNHDAGLKLEISGSAVVRDNEVSGNGFGNQFPPRGAGIMIRESGPVEVVGNRLWGNKEAIMLHHDDGRENPTDNHLHGIWIHDNEITLDGGAVGFFGDIDFDAFEIADLVFENNIYIGRIGERVFLDHGSWLTFEAWQDNGRDVGSSISEE